MKSMIVVQFIVLFAFVVSFNISAQDKKMEMKKKVADTETKVMDTKQDVEKQIEKTENKVVDNEPFNSVCPVSGEEVDSEITAAYNGKTYAFCCKSCLKKFNKNPDKYSSKLSEDGKSLKKKSNK